MFAALSAAVADADVGDAGRRAGAAGRQLRGALDWDPTDEDVVRELLEDVERELPALLLDGGARVIRIARLDLERWGHFDGRSLTFGAAGSLHVVYGPNEAGKSTTRRAVSALLFGVPARTRDTYGRPGADLRIGALLELGDRSLEVVAAQGPQEHVVGRRRRAARPGRRWRPRWAG